MPSATPSTKGKPTKADLAAARFADIIREAKEPIDARRIKTQVSSDEWAQWKKAQPWLKLHPRIQQGGLKYEWTDPIPAQEALGRLLGEPRAPQWWREALAEVVRAGFQGGGNPAIRAAQERQARIDAVRGVAAVAIEVEEIAHNGADSDQIVKRVRNAAAQRSLARIGDAGAELPFDPDVHKALSGAPAPGSPVFVLKPGYAWDHLGERILIERALVATV